mmetsp:Transcript_14411/g.26553  ORF Transcript_14411/g.26553 Transcript_14411/m.26553 type:complete len:509 (+) Transcript_14411:108-1634(+)
MDRLLAPFRSASGEGLRSSLLSQAATEDTTSQKELPSLPEVVNELGFGRAQLQVICTGGAIYFAASNVLMVTAASSAAVETDFRLTPMQKSSFVTVVFLGALIGNFLGGSFGDLYGRRLPILLSFAGVFLFSILSAFSWSYLSLVSLRFAVGLCIGMGQPAQAALITEVTPEKFRIFPFCASYVFFALGEILAGTMIWYDDRTMSLLHWRELSAAAAFPALIFGLASYAFLIESPAFLASTGQQDEAARVLETMKQQNGVDKELDTQFAMPEVVMPSVKHQLGAVFSWQQVPITMIMCMTTFLGNIMFYGTLYVFATILPQEARDAESISPAAQQIMGACWELLGYVLGGVLGSLLSRQFALQLYMWLTLVSLSALAVAPQSSELFYAGYYGTKVFPAMGWTVLFLFVAEVFPTECRATGTGICFFVGRMGAMYGPPAFELIEAATGSYRMFMGALAVSYVVNSMFLWLMPEPNLGEVDGNDGKKTVCYGALTPRSGYGALTPRSKSG